MLITENTINLNLSTWLTQQSYSKIFVLVDENTKQHCLEILNLPKDVKRIQIHSGEENKSLESCQKIWANMLNANADRNTLLINLGGGVITDIGGFCASTYKRGIDFINIPTTLLAQVDASIGAKTGIDFLGQKNMIGLFSEAKEVFIDPVFLKTLPERELKSGFAEVLKHGLISNEKYFDDCISQFRKENLNWLEIIKTSIEIKSEVVQKDPKESGLRKILNFGHTIGHSLETYSLIYHNSPILHGEAVALGMITELYLSYKKGFLSEGTLTPTISKLLSVYNFETLEKFDLDIVSTFILNDKKNHNNTIQCVLLEEVGKAIYDQKIEKPEISEALEFLFKTIHDA